MLTTSLFWDFTLKVFNTYFLPLSCKRPQVWVLGQALCHWKQLKPKPLLSTEQMNQTFKLPDVYSLSSSKPLTRFQLLITFTSPTATY